MGSKQKPGKFDCYDRARPDEPMFILLGRDPAAPATIRAWCDLRQARISLGLAPASDREKIEEARQVALDMERHREGLASELIRREESR